MVSRLRVRHDRSASQSKPSSAMVASRCMRPAAAYRSVSGGTGSGAAVPGYPLAGKTGSANENVDAWFCGYTAQIATCVWVGYPQGEIPMESVEGVSPVFGGTIPAAIWHDFMEEAMAGKEAIEFPDPSFDQQTVTPSAEAPLPPTSNRLAG